MIIYYIKMTAFSIPHFLDADTSLCYLQRMIIEILSVAFYPIMLIGLTSFALLIYESDGRILPFLVHGCFFYHFLDVVCGWNESDVERAIILDPGVWRSELEVIDKYEYLTLGRLSALALLLSIVSLSLTLISLVLSWLKFF